MTSLEAHPNNLPLPVTRLLGREHELEALRSVFRRQDVRLVTL